MKNLLVATLVIFFTFSLCAQQPQKVWNEQTKDRRKLKKIFKKKKKAIEDKHYKLTKVSKSKLSDTTYALKKKEKEDIRTKKDELTKKLHENPTIKNNKNPNLMMLVAVINRGHLSNAKERIEEDYKKKILALEANKNKEVMNLWAKKITEIRKMATSIGYYSYPVPSLDDLVKPAKMKQKDFDKQKKRIKKDFVKNSTKERREFFVLNHYWELNDFRYRAELENKTSRIELKLDYIKKKEDYALALEKEILESKNSEDQAEKKEIANKISAKFKDRALKLKASYEKSAKALSEDLSRKLKENQEKLKAKLESLKQTFQKQQESKV